jgi:hypothetical protein
MNFTNNPISSVEGEPYTYFTAGAYNTANTSRVVYGGKYTGTSSATLYWLRSKNASNSSYLRFYYIDTDGICYIEQSTTNKHNYHGILPVLRL